MGSSPSSPARILVRLPNWVGDAVMATAALRSLRRAFPEAHIALEGRPYLRQLFEGATFHDAFLVDRSPRLGDTWRRFRSLRREHFELAVILPDSPAAAIGPALARIPARIGYAPDVLRRTLLTRALDPPRENGQLVPIPMVERYLRLTRALGCADAGDHMELPENAAAEGALAARLAREGVPPEQGIMAVTPGASYGASKLWPCAHFAEACDLVSEALGLLPVIAPGPGESAVADAVEEAAGRPVHVLRDPPTTLPELTALLRRATLVLSNDTGPRAMAVAVGRPVVVLMGATDPRYTAMHLERQRVLREPVDCSPCQLKVCPIDHRCMTRLKPERVLTAARELLGAKP